MVAAGTIQDPYVATAAGLATGAAASASTAPPAMSLAVAQGDCDPAPTDTLPGVIVGLTPPKKLNAGIVTPAFTPPAAGNFPAVANLETAAVEAIIDEHKLDPCDPDTVRSWGRDDVIAKGWLMIVEAIETPAEARTADQQQIVAWMLSLVNDQSVRVARTTGAEYVKWAGINPSEYEQLMGSQFTEVEVRALLSRTPLGRNPNTGNGFCTYRPPSPFGGDYDGSDNQLCFTPCTNLLGCMPPTPTYDQFVTWGQAAEHNASGRFTDMESLAGAGLRVSSALALAGAGLGVAASVTGGVVAASVAPGAVAAMTSSIFPFASTVAVVAPGTEAAAATLGAQVAGAVGASAIASVASIVILAVTVAVLQGISVFDAADLPVKLASLIVNAPHKTTDLGAMLADPSGAVALYARFLDMSLPEPAFDCAPGVQVTSRNGRFVPCWLPPEIPAAGSGDPYFTINSGPSEELVKSPTIDILDTKLNLAQRVRLSGPWFVIEARRPAQQDPTIYQSLRLHYTDAGDNSGRTAWLAPDSDGRLVFVSVADTAATTASGDISKCVVQQTCFLSDAIHYRSPDGAEHWAFVGGFQAPQAAAPAPAPAPGPATIPVGTIAVPGAPPTVQVIVPVVRFTATQPITFTAQSSAPSGRVVAIIWQFERDPSDVAAEPPPSNSGVAAPSDPIEFVPIDEGAPITRQVLVPPAEGVKYSRAIVKKPDEPISYTWQEGGARRVRASAVDDQLRTASFTQTVVIPAVTSAPIAQTAAGPTGQAANVYAIASDGALKCYQHGGYGDGSSTWSNAAGIGVGNGWADFKQVFSASGVIYAITKDGQLRWYKHDGWQTCDPAAWRSQVAGSSDWGDFKRVFPMSVSDGSKVVLYAIDQDGNINWYGHTGYKDGSNSWEGPKKVGNGWGGFRTVFSTGDGMIYAVTNDGILRWYRHKGYQDGAVSWDGPKDVGTGWQALTNIVGGDDGVIYAVDSNLNLTWYRHAGYQRGEPAWDGPRVVGKGWNFKGIFVQPPTN